MKTKITTLLLIAAAAFTMSSCLDSDDERDFSTYYPQVAGIYDGTLITLGDTDADTLKTDLTGRIASTDSLVTITGVPASYLAKNIQNEDIKQAVLARGPQTLRAKFYIVSENNGTIQMYLYPYTITYNNLEYNGGTHNVSLVFYTPSGGYFYNSRNVELAFFQGALYIDETLSESFYNSIDSKRLIMQFKGQFNGTR